MIVFKHVSKTLLYLPLVNQTDNPAPKLTILVERISKRDVESTTEFFFFLIENQPLNDKFSCKLGWD